MSRQSSRPNGGKSRRSWKKNWTCASRRLDEARCIWTLIGIGCAGNKQPSKLLNCWNRGKCWSTWMKVGSTKVTFAGWSGENAEAPTSSRSTRCLRGSRWLQLLTPWATSILRWHTHPAITRAWRSIFTSLLPSLIRKGPTGEAIAPWSPIMLPITSRLRRYGCWKIWEFQFSSLDRIATISRFASSFSASWNPPKWTLCICLWERSEWNTPIMLKLFFYRNFENVTGMLMEKMKQTSKGQIILYWHHCLQHLFRFVDLQTLWPTVGESQYGGTGFLMSEQ